MFVFGSPILRQLSIGYQDDHLWTSYLGGDLITVEAVPIQFQSHIHIDVPNPACDRRVLCPNPLEVLRPPSGTLPRAGPT